MNFKALLHKNQWERMHTMPCLIFIKKHSRHRRQNQFLELQRSVEHRSKKTECSRSGRARRMLNTVCNSASFSTSSPKWVIVKTMLSGTHDITLQELGLFKYNKITPNQPDKCFCFERLYLPSSVYLIPWVLRSPRISQSCDCHIAQLCSVVETICR